MGVRKSTQHVKQCLSYAAFIYNTEFVFKIGYNSVTLLVSAVFSVSRLEFAVSCFVSNVSRDRIVSMKFMRKYIHVARDMKPVLTRDAADLIADEYSKLRNQDNLQQENIARVRRFCMSVT